MNSHIYVWLAWLTIIFIIWQSIRIIMEPQSFRRRAKIMAAGLLLVVPVALASANW